MLGLFRPAVYSFPQWLGMAIGFFLTYGFLYPFCLSLRHSWPICFWVSLALLLILHSHGLLLTSLGFPDPITLFSSLGFMGLPKTPYFLSLHSFGPVAALSHFSTLYIAHRMLFLSFQASLSPLASLRPICLFNGSVIHYSCRLGLMVLLSVFQFFAALVIGLFFFLLGFSQMALNNN